MNELTHKGLNRVTTNKTVTDYYNNEKQNNSTDVEHNTTQPKFSTPSTHLNSTQHKILVNINFTLGLDRYPKLIRAMVFCLINTIRKIDPEAKILLLQDHERTIINLYLSKNTVDFSQLAEYTGKPNFLNFPATNIRFEPPIQTQHTFFQLKDTINPVWDYIKQGEGYMTRCNTTYNKTAVVTWLHKLCPILCNKNYIAIGFN